MLDLLADLWSFMSERRKFWLIPLVAVLLVVGTLIILSEFTVISPFIYTLF